MPDVDKIIKGLELCKYDPDPGQENKGVHSCVKCPYYNDGIMPECQVMYTEAIELLKSLKVKKRCADCKYVKVTSLDPALRQYRCYRPLREKGPDPTYASTVDPNWYCKDWKTW